MPVINLPKKKRHNYYKNANIQKYYNCDRWRKLRISKLMNNPLCEMCLANEVVRQADEVHHIVKYSSGKTEDEKNRLAYDYENLMSLCKECHRMIHNR